jgi:hypothetical protein
VTERRRRARSGAAAVLEREATRERAPSRLRLDGATAASFVIALFFAWALWRSLRFGPRAGLFPWAVTIPTLAMAIAQLTRDVTGRRGGARPEDAIEAASDIPRDVVARRSTEICSWIVGYWVALWLLGFSVASLLMTFFYLKAGSRERWLVSALMSLAGFAFVYGIFEKVLAVPFPPGQLFVWLGYGG